MSQSPCSQLLSVCLIETLVALSCLHSLCKGHCFSSKAVQGMLPPGLTGPWSDSTPINIFPHTYTRASNHSICVTNAYIHNAFTHSCPILEHYYTLNLHRIRQKPAEVQISTSMHQRTWKRETSLACCFNGHRAPSTPPSVCPSVCQCWDDMLWLPQPQLSWQTEQDTPHCSTTIFKDYDT